MNQRDEFRVNQITKISFSPKALRPLQKLYWEIYAEMLEPGIDIGLKLHETSPGFDGVHMNWFFANSEDAITLFRNVLDSCSLSCVRDVFGSGREWVRVVQANIIEVRGSYPKGTWHTDFTDCDLGPGNCATLLAPLFTFRPHFGGLDTTRAEREHVDEYDAQSEVYYYRDGEAILFDGSAKIHRTKEYEAAPSERRILVCWQLADTSPSLHAILQRIASRNGDPMFFSEHAATAL